MPKRFMKYNPAFLTEQELVDSFVVRHDDLQSIVEAVRENSVDSNQHILVVGPRGIGKTTLVLRVAAEIRRNEELNREWYPLVFGEESYQVCSVGEFWLEALFHLGQQTKDDLLKATWGELSKEENEDRLRGRALARLMDFADKQGKRILLIVENFNMLLGEQMSEDDGWALRQTLLHDPRVMFLATATERFEEIDSVEKPMFELFKVHRLESFDEEECRAIWRSISGKGMPGDRIRPIQILTGGNPRLVAIVASFGARLSFRDLMNDLVQLVDEHTEYFKSHLDRLAPIERKAYLALAEIWDPASARDVAQRARLNVNKTSSLLQRLVTRGAVSEIRGGGRKKQYQVAERMYNIYYLMRRRGSPSGRVRAFVRFVVAFYEPEDLIQRAHMIVEEARALEPSSGAWIGLVGLLTEERGRGYEGIELAREFVQDPERVGDWIDETSGMFVTLAAAGYAEKAVEIIEKSPSAELLEPLVVGLRLYAGEDVRVATEILEVGRDVVERIEKRRKEMEGVLLTDGSGVSNGLKEVVK